MSREFLCPRCAADPQPANFGSPRSCAFLADGTFTPDNWNCLTLDALMELMGDGDSRFGGDESMQIVTNYEGGETSGWIVLTRYKRRGKTSSAMHVGDFWPAEPLTFALAESAILNGRTESARQGDAVREDDGGWPS